MSDGQKAASIRERMLAIIRGPSASASGDAPKPADGATEGDAAVEEPAAAAGEPVPEPTAAEPAAGDPPANPCDDDEDTGDKTSKPNEDMVASAVAAANTRWATVMRSEQAAGRTDAAVELLAESGMGADKIISMLGRLPAASANSFASRMAAEAPNPDVKPDEGGGKPAARNVATRLAAKHAPKKGN